MLSFTFLSHIVNSSLWCFKTFLYWTHAIIKLGMKHGFTTFDRWAHIFPSWRISQQSWTAYVWTHPHHSLLFHGVNTQCVFFFSQRPVEHSSPRPVHFRRFLAKMAYDLFINGLTGGHIMKRPNQPRPTALYITAKAGTPRWTCQYTAGYSQHHNNTASTTSYYSYSELPESSTMVSCHWKYCMKVSGKSAHRVFLIDHMHFFHGHLIADITVFGSVIAWQWDIDKIHFHGLVSL